MGSVLENKTVAMRIPCGSLTPYLQDTKMHLMGFFIEVEFLPSIKSLKVLKKQHRYR